jgi:PAS domain S-box-containing protein
MMVRGLAEPHGAGDADLVMSTLPMNGPPGPVVVAFTLCVIALMQGLVWLRERETGMPWLAAGSLASAIMTLAEPDVLPGGYVVRACLAIGLTGYLGLGGLQRLAAGTLLALPCLIALGRAEITGWVPQGVTAATPLLWADFGMSAACLVAAFRERHALHALLAAAPLVGPAAALLDPWRGPGPHLAHDFPGTVIVFGVVVLVVSLLRRSAEARRARERVQRLANFYAALSRTNQAILRIKDPLALYDEVCRICVDCGHAQMSCVYLDRGAHAERVAQAGPAETLFADVPSPWDITTPQASASYTVRAMREGVPLVCHDDGADANTREWQALAARHEIHAMAWLPLRAGGRAVGVLLLAARERGFFDEEVMRLLGEMTGDVSFALDNLDREAAHEQSMREVEAGYERFKRLFHLAPVGSAIITIDNPRIVDANELLCARQGATRAELLGRATDSLPYRPSAEDRQRLRDTLQRDGRVRNLVMHMRDAGGGLHVDLVNAEPIVYLGQNCLLFTSLDITEMQAAELARAALLESQAASRAKTQFLSHMSHELRTPLNAVIGFSELLHEQAASRLLPAESAQLDHIRQAGWHLLALINDVLDLSRIEAGQFHVELGVLDVAAILDDALRMVQALAESKGIVLLAEYRGEPRAGVLADPTRLRQAAVNVLTNAVKYNRPGGTVRVQVLGDGPLVAIEVTDTGIGMTPQQLQHVFEPFNRLGREREGFEGSGIGLALTRQLMRLMKGDITIDSAGTSGTRARLTLPRAVQAAATPAPTPGDMEGAQPRGTVLYIEDNAVNALLVEQMLARWPDVRLVVAGDGATGLRLAGTLTPDLVLADLQLPDRSGLDLLRELRGLPELQRTPVVVLSATAMPEDIQRARDSGAADFWSKPLRLERFLADVARVLREATELTRH